jgi:uncharacterized protein
VSSPAVRQSATGVRLDLRVMPRASRDEVGGLRDGRLVVRVTAPPVDRAANDAVVALLARTLDVSRRAIRVVIGETARSKTVEIASVTIEQVRRALRVE